MNFLILSGRLLYEANFCKSKNYFYATYRVYMGIHVVFTHTHTHTHICEYVYTCINVYMQYTKLITILFVCLFETVFLCTALAVLDLTL